MMPKRLLTFVLLLTAASFTAAQTPITWMIGLGTGSAPEQRVVQEAVIAAFNASQSDIVLNVIYVDNPVSVATLSTMIATRTAPDIVGPVGGNGTAAFAGNFLDLQPYVDASGYDLSQFPQGAVDSQRTDDGLIGLPLANFPAFLYYRPALFDEAGLAYPPATIGAPYMLDGRSVTWDVDTMAEVARRLTVDQNGRDASEPAFDPGNIVQWGFVNQWAGAGSARQNVTLFGAANVVDENGRAYMPDKWRTGWNWHYDAIWTHHFMPNAAQDASDLLAAGNPFSSGNVAMAQSHLWYTCCLPDTQWDAAALPSYEGTTTARLHADTFRVMNTTANPAAAFEVIAYLTGPAALDLLAVYGGMPARVNDQPAFFARLDERYTQGVNWEVVRDSLNYVDVPNHEAVMPNHNRSQDRLDTFLSLLNSQPGVNVDAEIDRLVVDLQAIFDEAR
jgi:multiple sugar transport system substrate-binding protein